jgi:hypothetical protein
MTEPARTGRQCRSLPTGWLRSPQKVRSMPVKGCGCSTTANDHQQCICAGQTGDIGADLGIPGHLAEFEL